MVKVLPAPGGTKKLLDIFSDSVSKTCTLFLKLFKLMKLKIY